MEANLRWATVTAVAPVAWGATYFVTRELLPPGVPMWGGVLRALPAGLLLLLVRRCLPHGSWWWRSLLLGTLNVGVFFPLVYLTAQLLPTSIASTVMAMSSMVIMLVAWLVLAERPRWLALIGAALGVGGVGLMFLTGAGVPSPIGLLTSLAAMLMSSLGYVLAKRWTDQMDLISTTAWQLVSGGMVLVPLAVALEGGPPALDLRAVVGFAYVSVVATAVAFVCWFAGLRMLSAGAVGLIGLLNPVTGVLLGASVAGDDLTARQVAGLVLVLLGVVVGQPATARLLARFAGRDHRVSGRPTVVRLFPDRGGIPVGDRDS